MFNYLLEKGANFNAIDKDGNTALILATKTGNRDLVNYLLGRGTIIDAKNFLGNTAFLTSAIYNKGDIAQIFINKGTDLKAKNLLGKNAMDLAKENKSKDFLAVMKTREKELIENMGKAIENNQKDIFDKILTEEIDFNILTKNSESLILKAVKSNNLYYINKLIEKKVELKGKKLIFNTNNKEIISILVKEKVDLEEKDKNGETVLVSAVKARETEKVKMLVELGAKTDVVDTKKNNLIDLAIMSNNSPLVTYFLEKGIKVNTKNKDLLVWGVQENNIKLVEVFGNNFGYLDFKDKQGRNLLMIAAINNSKNVAEYLVNRGLSLVEKDKGRI